MFYTLDEQKKKKSSQSFKHRDNGGIGTMILRKGVERGHTQQLQCYRVEVGQQNRGRGGGRVWGISNNEGETHTHTLSSCKLGTAQIFDRVFG